MARSELRTINSELRQLAHRAAEQVALQEIAAELGDTVTLADGLDPFGDHGAPHVVAQLDERADRALLDDVLVATAHERHVDLDDLGHQLGEAGEAGIAGADVVDRDAEAELAEPGEPRRELGRDLERGALGHLEDDPRRVPGEYGI